MSIDNLCDGDIKRDKIGFVLSILLIIISCFVFWMMNVAIEMDLSHNFVKSRLQYNLYILFPFSGSIIIAIIGIVAAYGNRRKLCRWLTLPIIIPILLFLTYIFVPGLSSWCSNEYSIGVSFISIVDGTINVVSADFKNSNMFCGILPSTNSIKCNNDFNFDKLDFSMGDRGSRREMQIPDSAFLEWGSDVDSIGKNIGYKKSLKLPPFPPIDRKKEGYRIGFCIGYQDCVYVRIDKVKRYY